MQERIMTRPYESGDHFRSSKFLVFANRFLALLVAAVAVRIYSSGDESLGDQVIPPSPLPPSILPSLAHSSHLPALSPSLSLLPVALFVALLTRLSLHSLPKFPRTLPPSSPSLHSQPPSLAHLLSIQYSLPAALPRTLTPCEHFPPPSLLARLLPIASQPSP